MKRIVPLSAVLVASLAWTSCGEKKPEPAGEVILSGYVVDAMCGAAYARKANPFERSRAHTRACGLEETCSASGYGIVTPQGWIKFDPEGDRKARAAMEASRRVSGLYFEAKGTIRRDTLVVTSLLEIDDGGGTPSPAGASGHMH